MVEMNAEAVYLSRKVIRALSYCNWSQSSQTFIQDIEEKERCLAYNYTPPTRKKEKKKEKRKKTPPPGKDR